MPKLITNNVCDEIVKMHLIIIGVAVRNISGKKNQRILICSYTLSKKVLMTYENFCMHTTLLSLFRVGRSAIMFLFFYGGVIFFKVKEKIWPIPG